MKTLQVKDRGQWRAWLSSNHAREKEVWVIYYRKASGKACLEYDESVEEALCFGWIDSLIRKIDEERYARKFTPRKDGSRWSEANKKRVDRAVREGRMTPHGMRKVEAAKRSGSWDDPVKKPRLDPEIPEAFSRALAKNRRAAEAFEKMAPSYRKQFVIWVSIARRPGVIEKRIRESISLLEKGKKLGLK